MDINLNKDVATGGVFVVVGASFAITATGYDIGSASQMGTGYFPFCLGILLAALGGFILVQVVRSGPGSEAVDLRLRALVLILAALLAFALLLRTLGLPLAAFITFVVSANADPETPIRQILIAGAALAVLVYLLFIVGLGLPIPAFPAF